MLYLLKLLNTFVNKSLFSQSFKKLYNSIVIFQSLKICNALYVQNFHSVAP